MHYSAETQIDEHAKEDGRNHVRPILAGPWCKDERQAKRLALAMKAALYSALEWVSNKDPNDLEHTQFSEWEMEACLERLLEVEEGRPGVEQPHPSEGLTSHLEETGGPKDPRALANLLGLDADYFVAFSLGKCPITEPIVIALSNYFDTTTEFWTDLQESYDLSK